MTQEAYCSKEIYKFFREKGFEGEIHTIFDKEGYTMPAITHQMAMRWLRETYRIDIVIEISDPSVKDRKYYCVIWDGNNNSYILDLFNSYEQACEAAIKYCLEKIIK